MNHLQEEQHFTLDQLHGTNVSRSDALARLHAFVPCVPKYRATRNYTRNQDGSASTSELSPFVTTRLLLESELTDAVLERYAYSTVEKFIQEVCWRTYWKGWLEMRPEVWYDYQSDLNACHQILREDDALNERYMEALRGETGLACFDAWVEELTQTGFLHNHVRMWFASIWTFTLQLPWPLGAALFLHHLLDGDAASNTLSWRWVAGIQTRGKHYLARASNIEKYTHGQFNPAGDLNEHALPIHDERVYTERRTLSFTTPSTGPRYALWLHPEECRADQQWLEKFNITRIATGVPKELHYLTDGSPSTERFRQAACADAAHRINAELINGQSLATWFASTGADRLLVPYAAVGPVQDLLSNQSDLPVSTVTRTWDSTLWPHATAGFFRFKKHLPTFFKLATL